MTQHIIFDLDGTLIDSKLEILDTYREVFRQVPTIKTINLDSIDLVATLQANLESFYGANLDAISKARKVFSEVYDQSNYNKTHLYNGVFDTLKYLHEFKNIIHIATNKRLAPTLRILEYKNLTHFIKSIKASDMLSTQLLSKEEMVKLICGEYSIEKGIMVGDSGKDVEAGNSCQLTTVAVTYGYEKKRNNN